MFAISFENKILFTYAGVLVLANILGGLTTVSIEDSHASETVGVVAEKLSEGQLDSLNARLKALLSTAETVFQQLEGDVTYQHDYAVQVFSNSLNVVSYYENFNVVDYGSSHPADVDVDGKSMQSSFWYKHEDLASNPNLDNSSLLDNSHGPMVRSNSAYVGVYMGFEDDLWRHFPYMNVGQTLQTKTYVCVSTGLYVTGYYPTCRGWYDLGKTNPSGIQYTPPYEDASTGQVMITLAWAVEVGSSLVGVVGSDISLDSLASIVLNALVFESGYTYMCDGQKQLIVHPDIDSADTIYSVSDLEFESESTQESSAFDSLLDDHVLLGETGHSVFIKGGSLWFVTYGPIAGTPYFLLMVVPESEVIEPATDVENFANKQIGSMIGVVVAICVVVLVVGFLLAHRFALMIVGPVLIFTKILDDIASSRLDQDYAGTGTDIQDTVDVVVMAPGEDFEEVSQLRNKMSNLILAVKFSTDAYYKNNYGVALQFLQQVEDMFAAIDQKRALGVVYNNRGNILRKSVGEGDKFESALSSLQAAVTLIQEFVSSANDKLAAAKASGGDVDAQQRLRVNIAMFEKILASRLSNYGDCLRQAERFVEAESALGEAHRLFEKLEDIQGMLQVRGNRGLLLLDKRDISGAETEFSDALEMANSRFAADVNYDTAAGIQFASMNMGSFYYECAVIQYAPQTNNRKCLVEKGLSCYYFALTVCDRLHKAVKMQCVFSLARIYKEEYGVASAVANRKLADLYPEYRTEIKDIGGSNEIHFIIDVSASMWGSRIKATARVLDDIVSHRMRYGDVISMDSFAKQLIPVVNTAVLDPGTIPQIKQNIANLIPSCTVGRTFFYKCLVELGNRLLVEDPVGPHVIVALTDGEDNENRTSAATAKGFYVDHNIKLVIVSVGVEEEDVVASLRYLATSPEFYVKAKADPQSIANALMTGFELATSSGNVVMEAL